MYWFTQQGQSREWTHLGMNKPKSFDNATRPLADLCLSFLLGQHHFQAGFLHAVTDVA